MTSAMTQEVPPMGVARSLRLMAGDIKLAHSIFALPFAVFAAFLAGPNPGAALIDWVRFCAQLGLVVLCMVLARTWAMLVNRLVDRKIDAANARTRRRVFAAGAVSPLVGWAAALVCAALLVLAAWIFQ